MVSSGLPLLPLETNALPQVWLQDVCDCLLSEGCSSHSILHCMQCNNSRFMPVQVRPDFAMGWRQFLKRKVWGFLFVCIILGFGVFFLRGLLFCFVK